MLDQANELDPDVERVESIRAGRTLEPSRRSRNEPAASVEPDAVEEPESESVDAPTTSRKPIQSASPTTIGT